MAERASDSSYRFEYSPSNRAKCKGPKPCSGTAINKGELRFGTLVDMRGNKSFIWRHWGCVTKKILQNVKKGFPEASEVDGFEELQPADQARIVKAWQDGHVAEEDIPESAKKPEGNDAPDEKQPKPKAQKNSPSKEKVDEAESRIVIPESNVTVDISKRISDYRENPSSIVGKKFIFLDANERWEVSEISFSKINPTRGMVTVGKYEERSQKIDFEVFMSMLKHGVLDVVQGDGA